MSKRIPTVVLDLDNCLVAFTEGLLFIYNQIHGTNLEDNDIKNWDFECDAYEDIRGNKTHGSDIRKVMLEFENHGLYNGLTPLPHAVQALRQMRDFGYHIVILTARPDRFGHETYQNLLRNQMCFDQLIFDGDKVKVINNLSATHEIVLFCDDKFEYTRDIAEHCNVENVCLINRPDNLKAPISDKIKRIGSVFGAIRYLKRLTT